ncbi:MAG: hypothetical protein F6J89_15470 [Symploca sp. SIO1C4]|uniref:Uncharacterized protein n=1 Tax=Symploca sp. SIO1C4 TaxID=2607765 RepID=A0A6B3NEE3_9CYAN|nr:hypothetical protein [Symploca sp. SIO1C4]
MGRWGDGEMERNECILQSSHAFPLQSKVDHNLYQGRMLSTLGVNRVLLSFFVLVAKSTPPSKESRTVQLIFL